MLEGKQEGFMIFGVKDGTHELVGTDVRLAVKKVGNETFLHWINKNISPPLHITHETAEIDGKHVEVICIDPAYKQPVRFQGRAYIRIDSSIHPIEKSPAKEEALWRVVSRFTFEDSIAASRVDESFILEHFFVKELVEKLSMGRLSGDLISYLEQEKLIHRNIEYGFDITNLLVILSARDFEEWIGFEKKGIRVIVYSGRSKINAISDISGKFGYFSAFERALSTIMSRIPAEEHMDGGLRNLKFDIPEIAIREILANSIVHQDLSSKDGRPTVEIFEDRVIITNIGEPVISIDRFIDSPSRSRNVKFADIMRRLGVCEGRGSGIDRAFDAVEIEGLPSPLPRKVEGSFVITIFGPREFKDLTREERTQACYWHCCLQIEKNNFMSNRSLRERFKLPKKRYTQVSEVISEAQREGLIKPYDSEQGNRNARYVPYWY